MFHFDDIFKYKGYNDGMKEIVLLADISNIDDLIDPILDDLRKLEVDEKTLYKIHLSLDEIITNVASYAYPDQKGDVSISYLLLLDNQTHPFLMIGCYF